MEATRLQMLLIAVASTIALQAHAFSFTRLLGSGDPLPGGTATLLNVVGSPAIDDGNVAFFGVVGLNERHILAHVGGVLATLVSPGSPVPGTSGATFGRFTSLSIDGDRVYFSASTSTEPYVGIYSASLSSGLIVPVLTPGMPTPYGQIVAAGVASSSHGNVLIQASTDLHAGAIMMRPAGATDLSLIAKIGDPIPGLGGTFARFWDLSVSGDQVAFLGCDTVCPGLEYSIFGWSASSGVSHLVSPTTPLPGLEAGSRGSYYPLGLSQGAIAFGVHSAGKRDAFYLRDPGGTFTLLAGGGHGYLDFPAFIVSTGSIGLDGGTAVFHAYPLIGVESYGDEGLYTTLGATPGTSLRKVIAAGDTLDGKTLSGVQLRGRQGLSGRSIVFEAYFVDGTHAIYRADAPFRWMTAGGGSFDDAVNWLFEIAPGSSDQALFDLPGSFNIGLTAAHVIGGIRVGAGAGATATVNLVGDGRVDMPKLEVMAGGRLNLEARNLKVGPADLTTVEQVLVQVHARQAVELRDNGRLEKIVQAFVDGPAATPPSVLVSGLNSTLKAVTMVIGDTGAGSLVVKDGAEVEISSLLSVAEKAGSTGAIEIDGAIGAASSIPARITGSTVNLGERGTGTMVVRNAAQVGIDVTYLGYEAGSKGKLTVTGLGTAYLGKFEFADVQVGVQGIGEFTISDKARVKAFLDVGVQLSGVGTVLVTGADTEIVSPELRAGLAGTGVVHVLDGAKVSASVVDIGVLAGGKGLVKVEGPGSTMIVTDAILIDELAVAESAMLVVANGASVQVSAVGKIGIGSGGVLELHGGGSVVAPVLYSEGTVIGNASLLDVVTFENNGVLLPGASPGTFTIDGDFIQGPGGLIEIEIAGTLPGSDYDVLNITGNANLGGTVRIIFLNGFAPSTGGKFAFLSIGGTLSSEQARIEVVGLDPAFLALDASERGIALVAAPVPEPLALWLMLAGLGVITTMAPRLRV